MIPYYLLPYIEIGNFTIPTYPLAHSLSYVVIGAIVLSEAKRRGIDLYTMYKVVLVGFASAIVGARIGGIITNFDYFTTYPSQILNLGSGGWTESGGFILSMILIIAYLSKINFSALAVLDLTAPAFAARFAVSRFGCSAVHDHIGKIMQHPWPWGVEYQGFIRHETGYYSLIANAIIFIILWAMRKRMKTRGMLFVMYLFLYSISVFIIRFFRAEDLPSVSNDRYFGLTSTQYIVIGVFIAAIFLYRYIKKHPIAFNAPFLQKSRQ